MSQDMSEALKSNPTIRKETFDIAWPSVVESVLVALAGMVDTYMVAGLGKASVAAIGVTNQPKYFVFTVFFATNVAISSLIARRVGEKKQNDANGLFLTGLYFVTGLSILLSILCVASAEPFMRLCGANAETIELSVLYFRIIMGFSIFQQLSLYINAAQRGSGNTKIAMTTNIVSNLVNVVLNYLLIQGHFGFPALGVTGAAIATVLGTVVACIMSVRSIFLKRSFIQIPLIQKEKIRADRKYIKELAPVTGTFLGENLLTRAGMMLTGAMTARIGTAPYAAHLVGMNFMNIGFAFGDGLQAAAIALVGRSIGENDYEKAKKYAWTEQKFGFIISIIISVLMLLLHKQIFNAYYPNDPEMLGYGVIISYFFAVIMPIQVSKIIFNGTLRAAGDIRYTLVGSTIGVTIVQPILLWFFLFVLKIGLSGVWLSILISQAVQWLLFGGRFISGKWQNRKL